MAGFASIDVKSDEAGLLECVRARGRDIRFFSAEELRAVPGEFSASAFVAGTVGVDNVCERSAVLSAGAHRGSLSLSVAGCAFFRGRGSKAHREKDKSKRGDGGRRPSKQEDHL